LDDLLKYYTVPPDVAMIPATEEQKRKVAELNQRVKENVLRIQNSTEFRNFLIAMSHFHNYSWNNQMLIWLQRPDATHVGGYNTWANLGRQVKAGEKGIAILAPLGLTSATSWVRATDNAIYAIKRSDKGWAIYDDNEQVVEDGFRSYTTAAQKLRGMGFVEHRQTLSVHNFKVVYVFDMAQTTGKPLPEFDVPILTGETNPVLFEQLLQLAKDEGVTVSFDPKDADPRPSTRGYYRHPKFIWIRPTEPPAQQLNVISHELAHYFTEEVFQIPRADAETIADSVAYIVDAHYGFDSGAHTFAYVALWAKDEKTLHANLNTIQKVSEKIIDALEERRARLMPDLRRLPQTTTKPLQEGDLVRLKSGTQGWIKGQIVEYTDLLSFPPLGMGMYTGPAYKVYILEGKHKGETLRLPANYVEPIGNQSSMKTNQPDKGTIEDWERKYSLQDLKKMARENRFDTSGTKRELIERILRNQWLMKR